MAFTAEEIAYLRSQSLARIATVAEDGQPDVVPVVFEFDGTHFYIGGIDPARARRTKNVRAGNTKIALVVDDLASLRPWSPRYLRVYGTAEIVERRARSGLAPILRIAPLVSWSVNLTGQSLRDGNLVPHKTIHRSSPPAAERG
jgi:pyridoxamine 5'-phosphate oxidase family protein